MIDNQMRVFALCTGFAIIGSFSLQLRRSSTDTGAWSP